jgi:uncharacterized protein (TIGR02300 family)
MAKPEWGTKRTGPCGTKFYDFNKRPIICPNCGGKVNTNEVITKFVKKEKQVPESSDQKNDVENSEDEISVLLDNEIEDIDNQKDKELQEVIDEDDELGIVEENINLDNNIDDNNDNDAKDNQDI